MDEPSSVQDGPEPEEQFNGSTLAVLYNDRGGERAVRTATKGPVTVTWLTCHNLPDGSTDMLGMTVTAQPDGQFVIEMVDSDCQSVKVAEGSILHGQLHKLNNGEH